MRPDQMIRLPVVRAVVCQATRSCRAVAMTLGVLLGSSGLIFNPVTVAQIPPPQLGPSATADLIARRAAILEAEEGRRAAMPTAKLGLRRSDDPGDGSSRFVPLREVVTPAEIEAWDAILPAERALLLETATQLFNLAMSAKESPDPPLAFIDDCLRAALARHPGHAEARRLLGFVPYAGKGWATPFAARELAGGKVKDPTFGWVPTEWLPHLKKGELPAPKNSQRWLPEAEADALRREWRNGWTIFTEHFEIHTNVPFAGAITFGAQLETLHQLFFAIMADLIGPNDLPLARRLRQPGLQPTLAERTRHKVYYFATRDEYVRLAPIHGGGRESLGIYIPRKEDRKNGAISYFFNDVNGQLDVTATLYHEVSHQLLFESAGGEDYFWNKGNYWVFEGLGTYFETLQPAPDGSIRIGGLVGPRIAAARQRIIDQRQFVPLETFVGMGKSAFYGDDGGDVYLHYAEAMAFAVFLMQAEQTQYREPFLDYARDAYRGQYRNGGGIPLNARLDRKYPELQREFLAYLARSKPPRAAVSPPGQ